MGFMGFQSMPYDKVALANAASSTEKLGMVQANNAARQANIGVAGNYVSVANLGLQAWGLYEQSKANKAQLQLMKDQYDLAYKQYETQNKRYDDALANQQAGIDAFAKAWSGEKDEKKESSIEPQKALESNTASEKTESSDDNSADSENQWTRY